MKNSSKINQQQTYTVDGIRQRVLQNRVNSHQMKTLHTDCIHLAQFDPM